MSKLIIGLIYKLNCADENKKTMETQELQLASRSSLVLSAGGFKHKKIINLVFANSNGGPPKSINDVATITFSFKTAFENELHVKKKIKSDALYAIEKRRNEIDFLEKDRKIINDKIVNVNTSEDDIKDYYKEIELINEQIRNHYKEIDIIKENLTTKIEFGNVINEYEFRLEKNHIQHINGLEDQLIPISILWYFEKDVSAVMDPMRVTINNAKSLHISYDTIMNDQLI